MTTTETSLRREIDRLRKTLADLKLFYGEPETWRPRPLVWTDDEGQRVAGTASPAMLDRGRKAREAG